MSAIREEAAPPKQWPDFTFELLELCLVVFPPSTHLIAGLHMAQAQAVLFPRWVAVARENSWSSGWWRVRRGFVASAGSTKCGLSHTLRISWSLARYLLLLGFIIEFQVVVHLV